MGVNGSLDPAPASCDFLLILVAGVGGKIGICTGLLLTWFVFLYFSNGALVKSMIKKNDTDKESDKENTQNTHLPASSKSPQYKSYLEELNNNANINELESIVNTNKESSNSPNDMKTSNNNVKNGNDSKRKTNVNIEKMTVKSPNEGHEHLKWLKLYYII